MSEKVKKIIGAIVALILGVLCGVGVHIVVTPESEVKTEIEIKPSTTKLVESAEEATTEVENDQGELTEGVFPTYEEVDGGQFEDAFTGISSALTTDVYYKDLGWSETYNVSSPEAFKNDTLGKCIIANNIYGAQCVSLSRVFWWSYADRDVSTCGTGAAKGMMNCYEENAGDDFLVYWREDVAQIQAGDWLVFDGGLYGHVGMALGPVVNGYVALLGENQGGASCGAGVGGSATNIINISVKQLIGFYRPKSYVKPAPAPAPEPEPESCESIEVKAGDTLGDIMKRCEGEVVWGEAMNDYARSWRSVKFMYYPTVFDGWVSEGRYGLFAGDTIVRVRN